MRSRYKILLVPAVAKFVDQMQMEYMGTALRALGRDLYVAMGPIRNCFLKKLCERFGYDVIFRVNRNRPQHGELPRGVRHVGWFQDFITDGDGSLGELVAAASVLSPHAYELRKDPGCMVRGALPRR